MSILVQCRECGKQYKLPDELAGRKVRCKVCGATIAIVDPNAAGPSEPLKTAHSKPRVDAEKYPLPDLDALISLEQSGTVHEEAPVKARRVRPAPVPSGPPVDWQPVDDKVAPAVASPTLVRFRSAAKPARSAAPFSSEGYLTLPFENAMDVWLPILSIGAVIVAIIFPLAFATWKLTQTPNVVIHWDKYHLVVGMYAKEAGKVVAMVVLLPAALLYGGIMIAAHIRNFTPPPSMVIRCLSVICTPAAVIVFAFGIAMANGEVATVDVWVRFLLLPIWGAVFWMLFRLRPLNFLVTLGCSIGCLALLVPLAIYFNPLGK